MKGSRAYFDTSALLKRYLSETGADRTRTLQRSLRVVSSAIMLVEVASTLSRHRTLANLGERQLTAILNRIRSDRLRWELMEVSAQILNSAEGLAIQTSLRPLDAIHVASALVFRSTTGLRLPFITADRRQREIAGSLNLHVVWVG